MRLPSRKFFLILVICCLGLTALLGIVAILVGLDSTSGNVLTTTAMVDAAAVLALCCAGKTQVQLHRVVQIIGFSSIAVSLVLGVYMVWIGFDNSPDTVWRIYASLAILSIACAHACLILPSAAYNKTLRIIISLTTVCIAVVAEMIANIFIFDNFNPGSGYFKALGVVLILDVLGSLLAIVLRRATKPDVVAVLASGSRADVEATQTPTAS